MKTIHKYPVSGADIFQIMMPKGAQILTVQQQLLDPQIWALVDTDMPAEVRYFRLAGMGHRLEENAQFDYIGTFQVHGGNLVFHLFEVLTITCPKCNGVGGLCDDVDLGGAGSTNYACGDCNGTGRIGPGR
jgi:hypothetical protein